MRAQPLAEAHHAAVAVTEGLFLSLPLAQIRDVLAQIRDVLAHVAPISA